MAIPKIKGDNPSDETIINGAWRLAVENVFGVNFKPKFQTGLKVWWTFVKTGDDAPTDLTDVKSAFDKEVSFIDGSTARDIYIYAEEEDVVVNIEVMSPLNTALNSALSPAGDVLVTKSFEENYREQGYERTYEDFIDSLPNGISYFLFDISGVSDRKIIVLPPAFSAESGPVTFEIYRAPTVTVVGAGLDTHNPVEDSSFIHQGKLYSAPTVTDEGSRITGHKFGSEGGIFTPDVGGTDGPNQPSFPSTSLLLKVTNGTGGTIDFINGYLSWFEIPIE